jgi:hypothetical protein
MPETAAWKGKIAGRVFVLRAAEVQQAVRDVEPEAIASHFVVVGDRRYPPKQVIGAVTGLDRADFTTHQARRTLMRLGFPAGRRGAAASRLPAGAPAAGTVTEKPLAERLRPFVGQWVAIADGDVIHAASTPQALVGWLGQRGRSADSVFRVPEDELAAAGLAPL